VLVSGAQTFPAPIFNIVYAMHFPVETTTTSMKNASHCAAVFSA